MIAGIRRRGLMNKPEEKGPIVNTYDESFTVTAHSSSYTYYFWIDFVIGATYVIEVDATNVAKSPMRINAGIQGNGSGATGTPEYTTKRTITIECALTKGSNTCTESITTIRGTRVLKNTLMIIPHAFPKLLHPNFIKSKV